MWSWALRSALSPPFSSMYDDHKILEGPENFVHPEEWWTSHGVPARWWHAKRPVVRDLLDGSLPLHVAFWDEHRRDLAVVVLGNDILAPYRRRRDDFLRSEFTALEFLSSIETRARAEGRLAKTP